MRNLHLDDIEMDQYALGLLPEEDNAVFEEHLLLCGSCQDRLRENDAFVRAMQEAAAQYVREKSVTRPAPKARMRILGSLAAGLLLMAGAAVWHLAQSNQQPAIVSLDAFRGPAADLRAPAGRELAIRFDTLGLPDLPSYELEIVDRWGSPVVRVNAAPGSAAVPPLQAGVYYIRLYAPSGELLREYGFQVSGRR